MQGRPEQRTTGVRESEGCIRATKSENGKAPGSGGAKAARVGSEPREGNADAAQTAKVALTGFPRIEELAKQDPRLRFYSLAHLITVGELGYAFSRLRRNAAVGVDGVTVARYEQSIEENLGALHERLRAGTYRHQPIRRVHIPKEPGKTRPIGVSCVEDKVVQQAVRDVLETIWEQDFLDCSYGFRPRRGAHHALRALDRMAMSGGANWVLEADIRSFFDSVDRKALMEMLRRRVADGRLLRLVGKCLHVGVLEGEDYSEPELGTAQGSVLSPLLGNIYLHYVLDEWFEQEVLPRLGGRARLIRYADDFVIGFERKDDAERVMRVLPQRMGRYGLELHPDKTRLVPFERPAKGQPENRRSGTFDFLGFTVYWRRALRGHWVLGMKTRKSRLRKAVRALHDFCRSHRHEPMDEQHRGLRQRLHGHFNYFGVNGNSASLHRLATAANVAWHKWLNRRSQRRGMTWERFNQLLHAYPLPAPHIRVQLWGATP
jgi:group II intron reverse transcriptase/maturase